MRPGEDMPRPRPRPRSRERRGSRRLRLTLVLVAAAIIIVLLSLRSLAELYTDYLWFDSVGFPSVWREVLFAKIILAVIFILIMFALLWINMYLADRFAPSFRPAGPEEEFVRRYHEVIGPRTGLVRLAAAALFAITWGITAGTQWQSWILFRNRVDFGVEDPQFGRDIGFYVFELPFIQFAVDWAFTAVLFTLIVTVAAHYLNGGIRVNVPEDRVTPAVKVHISVLLAGLALIQAVDYWYQRYALTLSSRGVVDGATYTDVNAQLPALMLLVLISLCAAALLIVNVRRRGWVLPAVAVGLWAFVAVVMGAIYPALYQRFSVEPSESDKESLYIERNIEATRAAYNMTEGDSSGSELRSVPYAATDTLTPELLLADVDTLENIRILDPSVVEETYEDIEAERQQYQFADVDVDRYIVDGKPRPVVIGARQLDLANLPRNNWETEHVSFTHGYGVALAPAGTTVRGEPDFVMSGLPTTVDADRVDVTLDREQLYFGELLAGYAIVGTSRQEVDYPGPDNRDVLTTYEGADGVRIGGFFRKAAFALRFGDINPLFSGLINSDSRVIFNRDVKVRAAELAPFLQFDADPYPVLVDGRVQWVLDAYTTTDRYPYSQQADRESLDGRSGLRRNFNYVRNSVKVVIDAYDGNAVFYVMDPSDPIITAYRKAFPELFTDADEMSEELRAHLRYPEDLFRVQTNMWGKYHIDEASDFFDNTGAWVPARAPLKQVDGDAEDDTAISQIQLPTAEGFRERGPIDPLYLQMQLPGEVGQEFVLYRPFVAADPDFERQELLAFMVARSDPEHYGELVVYEIPGTTVDGPALIDIQMRSNTIVSEQITLLGRGSSSVTLGNMVLVPVADNLVWVRPLYVSGDNKFPQFTLAIASQGGEVRVCPTTEQALSALFLDASLLSNDARCTNVDPLYGPGAVDAALDPPGTDDEPDDEPVAPPPPPVGELPDEVATLLREADEAFAQARAALEDGDLGRYQMLVDEAEGKLQEALAFLEDPDEG